MAVKDWDGVTWWKDERREEGEEEGGAGEERHIMLEMEEEKWQSGRQNERQ